MKIFSGSSNKLLAQKIAKELNSSLSPMETFIFPDGERRIRVEGDVVDQDTVIVQSASTPVDQNYMELFFITDALKRSGARSITAVVPYVGYQRQDHVFRPGEAVSLQVIIEALEAIGIDKIVAFDLHSIKIPEFFHIPIAHLSALSLFAGEIKKRNWIKGSLLVTPDMGGIRRIKIMSELLGEIPYGMVVKNRDLATGKVEAAEYQGDIAQRMIIVDDMASSGKTLVSAASLLKKLGAKEVEVFVTHPVFSNEAPKLLQNSPISHVFVTDSVYVPKEKHFPKLTVLSIAPIAAKELKESSR